MTASLTLQTIHPPTFARQPTRAPFRCSLRILIVAIAGILFLTLYPFHFDTLRLAHGASPFLLEGHDKGSSAKDVLLNILLFLPFGFGLAGLLCGRGLAVDKAVLVAFFAGAAFSYAIEFAQFFSFARDSGWEDVFTNSAGALVGGAALALVGVPVLRAGQWLESFVENHIPAPYAVLFAFSYLLFWFTAASGLARQSTVRVWNPKATLTSGAFGNGGGHISDLEFWDRALPDSVARALTSGSISEGRDGPISAYVFQGSAPFHDNRNLGPDLGWQAGPNDPIRTDKALLTSLEPVTPLIGAIASTGQFAIRLRFELGPLDGSDNRVLVLSGPGTPPDLEIRDRGSSLIVWFRTPLTTPPSALAWVIPFDFGIAEPHDLLISYDGSRLWADVDGRAMYGGFRLGPATALAARVRKPRTQELLGYRIIFYAIVFFAPGVALALAYRTARRSLRFVLASLLIASAPIAFEFLLTRIGGQWVSLGDIVLGLGMLAFGFVWMNSEGRAQPKDAVSTRATHK